ncbi:MAG: oligosaccharide flippase family protein [Verrucomicrobiota bacterium]
MGTRLLGSIGLFLLISRKLPAEELGLWGVFLALTNLFYQLDLGFAQNVTRAAGFAWAGAAKLLPFGVAKSDPTVQAQPNYPLLADLVATMRQYYRWVGLGAFGLGLTAGEWWIAHKSAHLANSTSLRAAWAVYAIGLLVTFWGGYWMALLNGINRVRQAQQAILVGQAANYVIGITGLILGGGIWSLVAGALVSGTIMRVSTCVLFRRFLSQAVLEQGQIRWDLIKVLWPNSWRLGAVSLGAYLILQANTLIGSALLDLGQLGSYTLSLNVVLILTQFSGVWVQVKLPLINVLRARGDTTAVAVLFADRVRFYLATFVAGAIGLIFLGPTLLTWDRLPNQPATDRGAPAAARDLSRRTASRPLCRPGADRKFKSLPWAGTNFRRGGGGTQPRINS